MGTRQLLTAELELTDCYATLLGKEGDGIRVISSQLNITRLHNGVAATGFIGRALVLAKRWAQVRCVVGGLRLSESPLHLHTLLSMECSYRACLFLTLDLVRLLQQTDTPHKQASQQKLLLPSLTPAMKLFTAKQAVALSSEALECCGGVGYLETSGLPRLLRDAQVLPRS